jgi:RNA polymerase sigma factor (sigma-70 family)
VGRDDRPQRGTLVHDEVIPVPSGGRQSGMDGTGTITEHLLQWQADGNAAEFEALVRAIMPLLERLASLTLRRHGIADASAIDDAVSLVLDHLRRLSGSADGERTVARFVPASVQSGWKEPFDKGHEDDKGHAGAAYVSWLIRERARDVARSRRRESRRTIAFSQLDHLPDRIVGERAAQPPDVGDGICSQGEKSAALHEAIAVLDPRLRTVIELLLDGNSQAAIAQALHVCEGTVSRMRGRAIMELRRLLGT